MSKSQKAGETREEYEINRKKRIIELLEIANVTEIEGWLQYYPQAGSRFALHEFLQTRMVESLEWEHRCANLS